MSREINKSDEDWKKELSAEQYHVMRKQGTERAFTGEYWDHHEKGVYRCGACGAELFRSEDKFDSGTGWPSFAKPTGDNHIGYREDKSFGSHRTEVYCKVCGGHLGHVFEDGPTETGQRFCINSASLNFTP